MGQGAGTRFRDISLHESAPSRGTCCWNKGSGIWVKIIGSHTAGGAGCWNKVQGHKLGRECPFTQNMLREQGVRLTQGCSHFRADETHFPDDSMNLLALGVVNATIAAASRPRAGVVERKGRRPRAARARVRRGECRVVAGLLRGLLQGCCVHR